MVVTWLFANVATAPRLAPLKLGGVILKPESQTSVENIDALISKIYLVLKKGQ